jgi:hypothetical protein
MVEIALCLAIIGFALVAIIGVLPAGMNVQRNNREETIINQDAAVWMNAIRSGAQGCDDLTNCVIGITNYWTVYSVTATETNVLIADFDGYDKSGCRVTSPLAAAVPTTFALANGARIIGLLSTPKIIPLAAPPPNRFQSNYIVASVRAMSGSAVEKYPQDNPTVLDSAFGYRMIVELVPYVPFDANSIRATLNGVNNPFDPALSDIGVLTNTQPPFPPDTTVWTVAQRRSFWDQVRLNRRVMAVAYTDSHDLRLTFRWPLLPTGGAGNGRQTFRLLAGGRLARTTDPIEPSQPLYFFQPSTYVQGTP